MSGCPHGVIQGYFLDIQGQGRQIGGAELDALCAPHASSAFIHFQCGHGMGHGLMAIHANHLPMALQSCDLSDTLTEPLLAKVNHNRTCNAFWNGSSINFFVEGGGCNNTARIFDVVAHEWGHGLDQNAPGGALDGALGEFIGDLVSFVQTKSPLLGLGFFKDGAPVRDLEDPEFRCYDTRKREVHDAGHMLGEVVWDIHQDLERIGFTGEPLKRLMLLPIAGAQSRAQWYRQMLAVDDDDGNLANGTPHECLIYNQFKAHSCNGTRWPGLPEKDPPGCSAN
jgi:hypothetical protein